MVRPLILLIRSSNNRIKQSSFKRRLSEQKKHILPQNVPKSKKIREYQWQTNKQYFLKRKVLKSHR